MIVRLMAALLVAGAGITACAASDGNNAAAAAPTDAADAAPAGMLPDRLLDCTLGRITNFDPDKDQKPSDFRFEGSHAFKLFLPSIPIRTTPPPPSTLAPEPVDPRTRVPYDPDRLKGSDAAFDRVVDMWPKRVELTAPLSDVAVTLIVVDQVDEAAGQAAVFVTSANDAFTFDRQHMFSGKCRVTTGAAATAAADKR